MTTAHTDGDNWVYFRDANVLALGDTFTRNYGNLDRGNGGTMDADLDTKCGVTRGLGTPTTFLRNVYDSFRNHD